MKKPLQYFYNQIIQFLTNKKFIFNLLGIIAFLLFTLFAVIQWLRIYTHHGQKLEMQDYVNAHISDAQSDAKRRSFVMIVNDSVHIVGKPGGIIQNQNPPGGSYVKEGRKIYVTTTKYSADMIDIASVLPLYGQDYESKKNQLQQKAIASEIKEFRYDPLTTGTILEVWHNDQVIIDSRLDPKNYTLERGSKLQFVISSPEGGSHIVPQLVGRRLGEARWTVEALKLKIGSIKIANDASVTDIENAVIISQYPDADGITTLNTGDAIDVVLKAQ